MITVNVVSDKISLASHLLEFLSDSPPSPCEPAPAVLFTLSPLQPLKKKKLEYRAITKLEKLARMIKQVNILSIEATYPMLYNLSSIIIIFYNSLHIFLVLLSFLNSTVKKIKIKQTKNKFCS